MKPSRPDHVRTMAVTAMLCAVAYLITFVFHFKVMFLTFDFKDTILVLTSLLFGPLYGLGSAALVSLLEFVTISDTGVYGLIMNFLSSAAMAWVAGAIYRCKRSFGGAVVGLLTAAVTMTAVMLLANYVITPFYMGVSQAEVAAMLPTLLLPFNLCKAVMNAAAVLLLYKPLISALRRTGMIPKSDTVYRINAKTVALMVGAVLVMAVSCAVLIVQLGGSAEWF